MGRLKKPTPWRLSRQQWDPRRRARPQLQLLARLPTRLVAKLKHEYHETTSQNPAIKTKRNFSYPWGRIGQPSGKITVFREGEAGGRREGDVVLKDRGGIGWGGGGGDNKRRGTAMSPGGGTTAARRHRPLVPAAVGKKQNTRTSGGQCEWQAATPY